MSDQGVTGGDVWIVPSTGGEPRDLTPGRPTSAEWIAWDGNQRTLRQRNQAAATLNSFACTFPPPPADLRVV